MGNFILGMLLGAAMGYVMSALLSLDDEDKDNE